MTKSIEELKMKLTPQQQKAAMLINQNELAGQIDGRKRTYEEIATEVGVDVKTLYNWRKNDANFIAYQNAEADVTLYSFREEADAMLMKLIRGGNNGLGSIKALQLYYQMIGKLAAGKEGTTVIVNNDTPRRSDEDIRRDLAELDKLLN